MSSPQSLLNVTVVTVDNVEPGFTHATAAAADAVVEKKKKEKKVVATATKKLSKAEKALLDKEITTPCFVDESVMERLQAHQKKEKKSQKILLSHLEKLSKLNKNEANEANTPAVNVDEVEVPEVQLETPVVKKRVAKPRAPSTKKIAAVAAAASAVCEVVTMVKEMKNAFTVETDVVVVETGVMVVNTAQEVPAPIVSDGFLEEEEYDSVTVAHAGADVDVDTDFTDEMIQELALNLPETPPAHRVAEAAFETAAAPMIETETPWIEDDLLEIASIPDEDEYTAAFAETASASATYDFEYATENAATENAATEKPKKATKERKERVPKAPKEPKQPKERKERVPKALGDRQLKPKTVFRHEFSDSLFQNLTVFTTATAVIDTTQFKLANAKAFKIAWTEWTSAHHVEIAEEVARLASIGYTGDALDKMFKTCRYYITNRIASRAKAAATGSASASASETASSSDIEEDAKSQSQLSGADSDATESDNGDNADNTKGTVTKKRAYIPIDKSLLQSMDEHIIMAVLNADDEETSPKPSECYAEFCSRYQDLILAETTRLLSSTSSESAISEKLKKTYKNRMFMVHNAHA